MKSSAQEEKEEKENVSPRFNLPFGGSTIQVMNACKNVTITKTPQ
jgi:hypothetical protein